MSRQISITVGERRVNVFLEEGYFPERMQPGILHKHCYPEIHWVMEGNARYQIGKTLHTVSAGEAFLIPEQVFHCCTGFEADTKRIAFQADIPSASHCVRPLSAAVIRALFPDWETLRTDQGTLKLTALLQLLCTLFISDGKERAVPIQDPSLIVEEFFSRRYNQQVTIADLARELMLSEKQTQRLVQEHTGRTFRKELTARREEVARQLLQTGNYTLAQVAEYVGFRSYSGFWKACRYTDAGIDEPEPKNPLRFYNEVL